MYAHANPVVLAVTLNGTPGGIREPASLACAARPKAASRTPDPQVRSLMPVADTGFRRCSNRLFRGYSRKRSFRKYLLLRQKTGRPIGLLIHRSSGGKPKTAGSNWWKDNGKNGTPGGTRGRASLANRVLKNPDRARWVSSVRDQGVGTAALAS